jgi:excisionase family DNA binding protein
MNAHDERNNEPLWTVEETAKFLNMSKNWVYRRTESGEIPHGKLGRVIRYSPARIREYAAQLHAAASSPNVVSLADRRRPRGKGGR